MDYQVSLLMTRFVTHDTKSFVVTKPDGFAFEPGQGVTLALDHPDWQVEERPFTPTSLPTDEVLEFTIKGYPEHQGVTRELHRLVPGDHLLMSKPFGTIRYRGPGVFIAGGAGVTPFLSIVRHLAAARDLEKHSLLFSNQRTADIICEKELRHYFGDASRFTCTRKSGTGYDSQRIDKEYLRTHVGDLDQKFYVCGPPAFVEEVNAALTELGADAEALVFEN